MGIKRIIVIFHRLSNILIPLKSKEDRQDKMTGP